MPEFDPLILALGIPALVGGGCCLWFGAMIEASTVRFASQQNLKRFWNSSGFMSTYCGFVALYLIFVGKRIPVEWDLVALAALLVAFGCHSFIVARRSAVEMKVALRQSRETTFADRVRGDTAGALAKEAIEKGEVTPSPRLERIIRGEQMQRQLESQSSEIGRSYYITAGVGCTLSVVGLGAWVAEISGGASDPPTMYEHMAVLAFTLGLLLTSPLLYAYIRSMISVLGDTRIKD